jgi:small subunit ribosomal protein S1
MTESFAELFEESLSSTQLRSGAIIIGTVMDITSEAVIVNAGLKSEGVIPRIQFLNQDGV